MFSKDKGKSESNRACTDNCYFLLRLRVHSTERQLWKLVSSASVDKVAVFRGGEGLTQTIDVPDLVVGDIIKIEQGMKVPADCLLLHGIDISCDESAMTGEIEHVEKS